MTPKIVFVANLWTLEGHPTPRREWSLARKVRAVAEAGFDAVNAPPSAELAGLVQKHGLRYMGFFASGKTGEFRAQLAAQRAAGAELVNVQLGRGSTTIREGTRLARGLWREASRQNIYAAVETHRNTATETPERIDAIADAFYRTTGELLPLTWDHSHLAVVKHLKPAEFESVLLRRIELIQAARIFHLRPFNGQHAQVPVFDAAGRPTPEFRTWLGFARALLALWLAGTRPGGELWVCPEIGPVGVHGYNLSTMPSSWEQAVVCRRELGRLWRQLAGGI